MVRPASIAAAVVLVSLCGVAAWQEIQVGRLRSQLARQTAALRSSSEQIATLSGQLALAAKTESALNARLAAIWTAGAADTRFKALLTDFDQTCADARDAAREQGFADGSSGMDLAITDATTAMVRRLAGYLGAARAERMLQMALVSDRAFPSAPIPAVPTSPAPPPTVVVAAVPTPVVIPVAVPVALPQSAQAVALATQEAAEEVAAGQTPSEASPEIAAYASPFFYTGPIGPVVSPRRGDKIREPGWSARPASNSMATLRDFAASAGIPINFPVSARSGAARY